MAVAGGTLVVVGVAALSVAMALTFSLWAGKPHEALSATYAVWAVWMLALLAWDEAIGSAAGVASGGRTRSGSCSRAGASRLTG